MDFAYTIAGFAVGAIVGLTGAGGGSLMTPLLVPMFGIHRQWPWVPTCSAAASPRPAAHWPTALKGLGLADYPPHGDRQHSGGAGHALWAVSLRPRRHGRRHACHHLCARRGLVLTAVAIVFRSRIQAFSTRAMGNTPNLDPHRIHDCHRRSAWRAGIDLRSAPAHSVSPPCSFRILRCLRCASSAPTSPMRCRSRPWPAWATGRLARSTGHCSAAC